ncbi:hypothetical protein EJB05_25806 [Eragrostis curvula]|uniref:Bifunctional inhibitor/plant lipid transfer protein/seed storage helical domain-containing protein n=1 Tax=Eragrostis curvula TaxID=38414 RepID=A0A5J9UI59_9POAL|nr:hypothetical protein EJB05_25732 [Eragrostis curvula]TVU23439.1 hypothetical protein EJB05_25806 [Eragrostis curvula]
MALGKHGTSTRVLLLAALVAMAMDFASCDDVYLGKCHGRSTVLPGCTPQLCFYEFCQKLHLKNVEPVCHYREQSNPYSICCCEPKAKGAAAAAAPEI